LNFTWGTQRFLDSFQNFIAGLGTAKDKSVAHHPVFNQMPPSYLETLYRGDWLSRKIIDVPAFDCTRAWRSWQATKEQIEALELTERAFGVQMKLMHAFIRARLWGGALLVMGVDRQGGFNEPLDVTKVGKGDLKFIHVVSKWGVGIGPMIRDITNPWYGQPEYYFRANTVVAPSPDPKIVVPPSEMGYDPGSFFYVHPSRCVRLTGADYPDMEFAPDCWGDSVLQVVYDAIRDVDLVSSSVAAAIAEMKYDIIRVPGLTTKMATKKGAEELANRFGNSALLKSVVNSVLLDVTEEWQTNQVRLQGYDKVMNTYMLLACGAADIPATRLMGREPAGMNATGESDIRNYYDRLSSEQNTKYTPTLAPLDEVLIRHTFGSRDPSIHYEWNPLWQEDNATKATIAFTKAQAFNIHMNSGLLDANVLKQGLENQLIEDGLYPSLDQLIDEANVEPDLDAPEVDLQETVSDATIKG